MMEASRLHNLLNAFRSVKATAAPPPSHLGEPHSRWFASACRPSQQAPAQLSLGIASRETVCLGSGSAAAYSSCVAGASSSSSSSSGATTLSPTPPRCTQQRSILHYLHRRPRPAQRGSGGAGDWSRLAGCSELQRSVLAWLGLGDAACAGLAVCRAWRALLLPTLPRLARCAAFGSEANFGHLLAIQTHRRVRRYYTRVAAEEEEEEEEEEQEQEGRGAPLQPELTPLMRAVLADWLVDVATYFRVGDEAVHLALAHVDAFLSVAASATRPAAGGHGGGHGSGHAGGGGAAYEHAPTPKSRFQLLGIAALFVAAKFVDGSRAAPPPPPPQPGALPPLQPELTPPQRCLTLAACADVTDNAFTVRQVLGMERDLCAALRFRLWGATPLHFLGPLAGACEADGVADEELLHCARFVADLALLRASLARAPRLLLAGSALLVARHVLRRAPLWPPALRHATGIDAHLHSDDAAAAAASAGGKEATAMLRRICNQLFRDAATADDPPRSGSNEDGEPLSAIAAKFPAAADACAEAAAAGMCPPFDLRSPR